MILLNRSFGVLIYGCYIPIKLDLLRSQIDILSWDVIQAIIL